MSFLVRKINIAKWFQSDLNEGEEVSADAITSCLRTTKNTLSFWYIDNLDNLKDVVLAMSNTFTSLDKADFVILDFNKTNLNDIQLKNTISNTKYNVMNNSHYDFENLNYKSLGVVKDLIKDELIKNSYKTYTKSQIKEIIKNALDQEKLNISDLQENLKKDFQK